MSGDNSIGDKHVICCQTDIIIVISTLRIEDKGCVPSVNHMVQIVGIYQMS